MASVRLSSGPALLVDTGSPGNVCGDETSSELADAAAKAGKGPHEYQQRSKPLVMSGIGTGSQVARYDVLHNIGLKRVRRRQVSGRGAPRLVHASHPGPTQSEAAALSH